MNNGEQQFLMFVIYVSYDYFNEEYLDFPKMENLFYLPKSL